MACLNQMQMEQQNLINQDLVDEGDQWFSQQIPKILVSTILPLCTTQGFVNSMDITKESNINVKMERRVW